VAVSVRHDQDQLRWLSLSTRDHPAGRLVLCPFTLSFRYIEDLMAERGIMVSYETVRRCPLALSPYIVTRYPKASAISFLP